MGMEVLGIEIHEIYDSKYIVLVIENNLHDRHSLATRIKEDDDYYSIAFDDLSTEGILIDSSAVKNFNSKIPYQDVYEKKGK